MPSNFKQLNQKKILFFHTWFYSSFLLFFFNLWLLWPCKISHTGADCPYLRPGRPGHVWDAAASRTSRLHKPALRDSSRQQGQCYQQKATPTPKSCCTHSPAVFCCPPDTLLQPALQQLLNWLKYMYKYYSIILWFFFPGKRARIVGSLNIYHSSKWKS